MYLCHVSAAPVPPGCVLRLYEAVSTETSNTESGVEIVFSRSGGSPQYPGGS